VSKERVQGREGTRMSSSTDTQQVKNRVLPHRVATVKRSASLPMVQPGRPGRKARDRDMITPRGRCKGKEGSDRNEVFAETGSGADGRLILPSTPKMVGSSSSLCSPSPPRRSHSPGTSPNILSWNAGTRLFIFWTDSSSSASRGWCRWYL